MLSFNKNTNILNVIVFAIFAIIALVILLPFIVNGLTIILGAMVITAAVKNIYSWYIRK